MLLYWLTVSFTKERRRESESNRMNKNCCSILSDKSTIWVWCGWLVDFCTPTDWLTWLLLLTLLLLLAIAYFIQTQGRRRKRCSFATIVRVRGWRSHRGRANTNVKRSKCTRMVDWWDRDGCLLLRVIFYFVCFSAFVLFWKQLCFGESDSNIYPAKTFWGRFKELFS